MPDTCCRVYNYHFVDCAENSIVDDDCEILLVYIGVFF